MGLTQRQATGKFTRDEAEALIAQLHQAEGDAAAAAPAEPEKHPPPPSSRCDGYPPTSSQVNCNTADGSSSSPDAGSESQPPEQANDSHLSSITRNDERSRGVADAEPPDRNILEPREAGSPGIR
jgi:hypothetical protein